METTIPALPDEIILEVLRLAAEGFTLEEVFRLRRVNSMTHFDYYKDTILTIPVV